MKRAPLHRGFSMVEAVAAVALVGSCVVVVMTAASGAVARREIAQSRGAASLLVAEVLEEMRPIAYQDPTLATTTLGPESGETLASRADADDADDLNGWTESGLRARSGSAVAVFGSWTRRVTVQWVSASDFLTVQGAETGAKRITVTVERGSKILASGSILRVKSWEEMSP